MRLWTLHPKYLDARGLCALWREALLARAVLRGRTKGYRHHPQLHRFQMLSNARSAIDLYLAAVLTEAHSRGYSFDRSKIGPVRRTARVQSTDGQLAVEWRHLMRKLQARSPDIRRRLRGVASPEAHPLFDIRPGPAEPWERLIDERH